MKHPFAFKKFRVFHDASAMKVGVDSVLLGAWADVEQAEAILDVGTGCGLLALMCAQRNESAIITGVEIESAAAEEARLNFENSPWSSRLFIRKGDYMKIEGNYDFIISNPPYFKSGVEVISTNRELARHQSSLTPGLLFRKAALLLRKGGKVALIMPANMEEEIVKEAKSCNFNLKRLLKIKGRADVPPKRVIMEFEYNSLLIENVSSETLILEISRNVPTEEYLALCHDFYLKF